MAICHILQPFVRHSIALDVEDINDLLVFRIAMVPKTWKDEYGDYITKTSEEISKCLNAMLDEKAKVDVSNRRLKGKTPQKWNKNKNKKNKWKKKKLTKEEWKAKQEKRKQQQYEKN